MPLLAQIGEDPAGDLVDELSRSSSESACRKAIEQGFLGFLRKSLGIVPGEKSIRLSALDRAVLLVNKGDLSFVDSISPTHEKLLRAVGDGPKSKKFLVEHVWGYTYDPSRHDGLLYSSVRELRKKIGGGWFMLAEEGYRLAEGVRIDQPSRVHLAKSSTNEVYAALPVSEDLNFRQHKIVEALLIGARRAWTQRECRAQFKTSTMTSTRDLSDLVTKGILLRIGRGRAVTYFLNAEEQKRN